MSIQNGEHEMDEADVSGLWFDLKASDEMPAGMPVDPFMGSGSTIAAAEAVGYDSAGVELDEEYFKLAERSITRLADLYPGFIGEELQMNGDYGSVEREDKQQLAMVLAEKKVTYRTKLSAKTQRS